MAEADTIAMARHNYFNDGQLPSDRLSHAILRSWIRCSEMGLKEKATPIPDPLPAQALRQLCERHERFRRLCRPELEMLNMEARETGSAVMLADGAGMILDTLGDTAFAGRAAQVALRPGVPWSEASTGTNAIGTALAERRPTAVHGHEHFFADHQILSCAATPIMDPRGAILGVLDLSGPATVPHTHALGLTRMAADQIEHRLFRRRFDGCRILRFHGDSGMLGTTREGILVFRDTLLVAANRRGLSLVGRGWDTLDDVHFEELFDGGLPNTANVRLRTPHGDQYVGDWRDGDRQETDAGALSIAMDTDRGTPVTGSLLDAETLLIRETVSLCGGNITQAARRLGIHRSTIYRRLGTNLADKSS